MNFVALPNAKRNPKQAKKRNRQGSFVEGLRADVRRKTHGGNI